MAVARTNLLGLDRKALARYFVTMGEKPFRADQMLKWIYQHGVTDFQRMSNLSKILRQRLDVEAEIALPDLQSDRISDDGTRKWLFRVDANNCVEAVYIPEPDRATLCVSSQVGCALKCSFCATARQGFSRNLSSAEVVGQLWRANEILGLNAKGQSRITNVVLMGMGEPLLNLENVVPAMNLMMDDCAFGLAKRRVTLSTSGIVPAIDRLKALCPVSLAVSLHAPDDSLRDRLVPVNRKYPIHELLAACRRYLEGSSREKVTFEYVMIRGVNDSPVQARALAKRLQGAKAKINLIPFNSFADTDYQCSERETIDRFREILTRAGLVTVTRKTRGDDIAAACGQLAGAIEPRGRTRSTVPIVAGAVTSAR